MLDKLNREDRLRLMKFVCSFAWADLEVRDEEREFVADMVERLELDAEEVRQVRGWLESPPRADEVDPNQVPPEHREVFVSAARAVLEHDGEVNEEEAVTLELFRRLTR
jgi:tellurite resistance protein